MVCLCSLPMPELFLYTPQDVEYLLQKVFRHKLTRNIKFCHKSFNSFSRILFFQCKAKLINFIYTKRHVCLVGYLPQLPRIYGDLKAFLIGLFEQWTGNVSIDTLPPNVCVQKTASHVVARLFEWVPKLWAVPRAPASPVEEKRGGDCLCRDREIEKKGNCGLIVGGAFWIWFICCIEVCQWCCKKKMIDGLIKQGTELLKMKNLDFINRLCSRGRLV